MLILPFIRAPDRPIRSLEERPMVSVLVNFLVAYSALLLSVVAQISFLVLPVNLRNWDDDFENVLTYIGFQLLAATFFFVMIPRALGGYHLGPFGIAVSLGGVFLAAVVRCLKLIPLEFTDIVVQPAQPGQRVDHSEFHTPTRLHLLSKISLHEADAPQRIEEIVERLSRKRVTS